MRKNFLLAFSIFLIMLSSCNQEQKKSEWVDCELIPVCDNNKWGYINGKGEWVIKPQFYLNDPKLGGESISFFAEGLARVKGANGLFGFINAKGDFVIPPQYKRATSFHEGVALCVRENESIEGINPDGATRFKLDQGISKVSCFFEGLAAIRRENINRFDSIVDLLYKTQGYIDLSGKIVIPCNFYSGDVFHEGFTSVIYNDSRDSLVFNLINHKGDLITKSGFTKTREFSEGLAGVKVGDKWGFIDTTGNFVIKPQFDEVGYFHEGRAYFLILPNWEDLHKGFTTDTLWGFIDKKGNKVIRQKFKSCSDFTSGIAAIMEGDKYGYIKLDGNYLIQPCYKYAEPFNENGLAIVVNMFDKRYIIKKDGNMLNGDEYDRCRHYQCNYMLGITNSGGDANPTYHFKIINTDGTIVGNRSFDDVKITDDIDKPEDVIFFESDFFDVNSVVDSIINILNYPLNAFTKKTDGCKVLTWLNTINSEVKSSMNEKDNIIERMVELPYKSKRSSFIYSIFDRKITAFEFLAAGEKPSCASVKFQGLFLPYECSDEKKAQNLREALLTKYKTINGLTLNIRASEKDTYVLNNENTAVALILSHNTVLVKIIPLK